MDKRIDRQTDRQTDRWTKLTVHILSDVAVGFILTVVGGRRRAGARHHLNLAPRTGYGAVEVAEAVWDGKEGGKEGGREGGRERGREEGRE